MPYPSRRHRLTFLPHHHSSHRLPEKNENELFVIRILERINKAQTIASVGQIWAVTATDKYLHELKNCLSQIPKITNDVLRFCFCICILFASL